MELAYSFKKKKPILKDSFLFERFFLRGVDREYERYGLFLKTCFASSVCFGEVWPADSEDTTQFERLLLPPALLLLRFRQPIRKKRPSFKASFSFECFLLEFYTLIQKRRPKFERSAPPSKIRLFTEVFPADSYLLARFIF